MSKLWEVNAKYDESKPQSLDNMPYKQLYKISKQLPELLQDAKSLRWEVLDLENTQIRTLPESIGNLSNLKLLNLHGCPIETLPESIWNLSNLQSLDLYATQIETLPENIGNLSNLQELDLSYTQIKTLPESIGNLSNLKTLSLRDTQISTLPKSIEKLSNLQLLNLSFTQINTLPENIGNLSNLKTLNLSYCHLKKIPYSVVALRLPFVINDVLADNCINLSGVILDEGDLQLFMQPREVIEAAYQKQTQIRECKVIFLGDGGAGKTALIERITKGTFTPGTPPTDGVEMTKWNWFMSVQMTQWEATVKDEPFTVRFLDFGGQDIMHSAHRCFLTAHTVYVIVCDSRDDPNIDATAVRWLESVNSFAPGCPVILALNKADLNKNVEVDNRDLKRRNPALQCVLKTSAADEPDTKYGVNHLINAIRDEIPGAVNDYKLNKDMLDIKQALEEMKENYIFSKDYRAICTEHHITDEKLQYSLLGFFRDLGVVYYYETPSLNPRLESVRVLNPEWLTNGIYRLILRTPESGFLRHKTIKDTLRATHAGDVHREITYTSEETDYILQVMHYFELSHDMGDGVEMIPLKMSKTPPDTVDDFPKQDALHLRWEGTYLPNNLIHRLLIRKFAELDTQCVWRTGGHFRQTGGDCEALAEMNEKALDVYVSGAHDCRQYLETFRAEISRILVDLNLKPSEMICHTVNGREGKVSYPIALKHYHLNKEEICLDTGDFVPTLIMLKEIYVDVEKELQRYRQQLDYESRSLPLPVKPDNPLEEKRTRAEIDNIIADTENKIEDTIIKRQETKMRHLKYLAVIGTIIGAFVALLFVAIRYPDKLPEIWKFIMKFFGGE